MPNKESINAEPLIEFCSNGHLKVLIIGIYIALYPKAQSALQLTLHNTLTTLYNTLKHLMFC